jgi:hypothetical protein
MPRKPPLAVPLLLSLLGVVALGVLLFYRSEGEDQGKPLVGGPTTTTLRQAPGVVRVEELVSSQHPTHRIIHVRDWHFVPRDLFAIDIRQGTGKELTEEEVSRLYQRHLEEVEALQVEQMALLRHLASRYGIRQVLKEAVTQANHEPYLVQVEGLRQMEREEIPTLRKQLAEVEALANGVGDDSEELPGIEANVRRLLGEHRARLLEVGAPGRLLMAGEIDAVLPLDDEGFLDKANPVTAEGEVRFHRGRVRAREDFMVGQALAHGPVAVIILGGSHDLSPSVRRLGKGKCEYLRVTLRGYPDEGG